MMKEWIKISKWIQIQSNSGDLVPIILFEPTLEFLTDIRNSLEDIYYKIDIVGTQGVYDGFSFTAILDKTTIGNYYALYIQIPFTIYPCQNGYFHIVPSCME
jgi:hypothetical protein